eukprot:2525662-Alexandrium_andersonii.AAC.1
MKFRRFCQNRGGPDQDLGERVRSGVPLGATRPLPASRGRSSGRAWGIQRVAAGLQGWTTGPP